MPLAAKTPTQRLLYWRDKKLCLLREEPIIHAFLTAAYHGATRATRHSTALENPSTIVLARVLESPCRGASHSTRAFRLVSHHYLSHFCRFSIFSQEGGSSTYFTGGGHSTKNTFFLFFFQLFNKTKKMKCLYCRPMKCVPALCRSKIHFSFTWSQVNAPHNELR